MPLKSICPKCGKEGNQHITWQSNKTGLRHRYLEIVHTKKQRCYLGRIRTTEEVMGELNEPQSIGEYKKVIREIVAYGNSLVAKPYRPRALTIRRELKAILDKYGLWS